MNEKGVSNNKTMRGVSDWLDDKMEWEGKRKEESGTRGIIHGTYHTAIGIGKAACLNLQGASAEFGRAGEQFSKGRNVGRSPPRSKK